MSQVYPAPGFLLIEILEDDNKTKEGIYLPQDLQSEPMKGKVVRIGYARTTEYGKSLGAPEFSIDEQGFDLVEGDIIYFKTHTQYEISSYDDMKLAFIPFETVCGLIVEDKK